MNKDYIPLIKDEEIESLIVKLMYLARGVSNIKKPWSDNSYGKTASQLCFVLPSSHPLYPKFNYETNTWDEPLSNLFLLGLYEAKYIFIIDEWIHKND